MADMRTQAKRKMRERSQWVYIGNGKLRRGTYFEWRAIHPEFGVLLTGWAIADSNNPVCHVL